MCLLSKTRFPTVDFHTDSQRLAVGTSEGAVIMYDLKTATRLYILEGHRKRLAGISFSPDGRRLVTLGLEESVVLVWKVGSSFTSFFHPGAPPRQGHAGSDPYKTLNFVLVGGSEYRPFPPLSIRSISSFCPSFISFGFLYSFCLVPAKFCILTYMPLFSFACWVVATRRCSTRGEGCVGTSQLRVAK